MDIDTGVIQHIGEITFIYGLTSPFRWYTHTIIMGPDNNLYGIAEVVITAANPQNYFVKINTTDATTQLICGNVGFLFGYATDSLLITKDGVVYFKSQFPNSYLQRLNLTNCAYSNVGVPFNSTNGVEYGGNLYFTYNNQLMFMALPDYTLQYDGFYNLPYNVTMAVPNPFTGFSCTGDRCTAPVGIFPYEDAYGVTSLRTLFLPDPRDTEYFVQINIGTGTTTYFLKER